MSDERTVSYKPKGLNITIDMKTLPPHNDMKRLARELLLNMKSFRRQEKRLKMAAHYGATEKTMKQLMYDGKVEIEISGKGSRLTARWEQPRTDDNTLLPCGFTLLAPNNTHFVPVSEVAVGDFAFYYGFRFIFEDFTRIMRWFNDSETLSNFKPVDAQVIANIEKYNGNAGSWVCLRRDPIPSGRYVAPGEGLVFGSVSEILDESVKIPTRPFISDYHHISGRVGGVVPGNVPPRFLSGEKIVPPSFESAYKINVETPTSRIQDVPELKRRPRTPTLVLQFDDFYEV